MSNTWTDELHGRKGKVPKEGKAPAKNRVADLQRMVGRTPEVVVQISPSKVIAKTPTKNKDGSLKLDANGKKIYRVTYPSPRDKASLLGLVNYVSRVSDKDKNDLEMTDEQGLTYSGRAEVKEAVKDWNMPDSSNRREVIHVVLSMPRDTPDGSLTNVAGVERAASKTADKLFDGHAFLITHHRDGKRGNPHAHILVRMEPKNGGKRLNPKKADLQRYRETYAYELREQNVEANATTARQRFSRIRNIPQASEQMYRDKNRRKNEEAEAMGVAPGPDEHPNRLKKALVRPDMDQYKAHIAAIKEMTAKGQRAGARAALTWLNRTAPAEAEAYGDSDSVITSLIRAKQTRQEATDQAHSDDQEPTQSM